MTIGTHTERLAYKAMTKPRPVPDYVPKYCVVRNIWGILNVKERRIEKDLPVFHTQEQAEQYIKEQMQ